MYLIQILLPTTILASSETALAALNQKLVERFGGVTAYTQSPAKGKWLTGGREERDDIVLIEVMANELDRTWWEQLRKQLEAELRQDEIVIRSHVTEQL